MSVILEVDTNVFLITETAKPQVKQQKRLFIICDDCNWCASAISQRYFDPVACPECGKPLSLLSISNDERYNFNYDRTRGVELDFYSNSYERRPGLPDR
jgi:hypothetical protein